MSLEDVDGLEPEMQWSLTGWYEETPLFLYFFIYEILDFRVNGIRFVMVAAEMILLIEWYFGRQGRGIFTGCAIGY